MGTFEELKPGARIRGLDASGVSEVVQVARFGPDVVNLIFRVNGKVGERLVYRGEEAGFDYLAVGRGYAFDADGGLLRLVSEAYRIRLAHLFDPYLAVSASQIEALPHQITAVYGEMLPRQPLRFLLADDPGAGKTVMAGLLIKELLIRGDLERCLIVAPGSLVEQWQEEMAEKFGLHFDLLTRDQIEASVTGNPFVEKNRLILRLDMAARSDELKAKLEAAGDWDLIICDEAHRMAASYFGGEVKETQRHKLGKLLGTRTRNFLLMSATPHNGKEADFQLFMGLLDADRFEGRFREGVHKADVSDMMRRLTKEELYRFDGTPLFPERRAYTASFALSPVEADLYQSVTTYVREEMNRADRTGDEKRRSSVGFALQILQRRLASSPAAIHRSLERRRRRLEDRLHEERLVRGAGLTQLTRTPVLPNYDPDDLDEVPGAEAEAAEEQIVDQATAAATVAELETEILILRDLEDRALRLKLSGQDAKWRARRKQKAPKGYPTAIHKYWAQRPIAACRAILFSQLVDDPSAWPDRYPTEQLQDSERRRLHKIIGQMALWESSNNLDIMNEARWEIARSIAWNRSEEPPGKNDVEAVNNYLERNAPPVFDPFSGAGSIPLEAQRLGLQANGSDLNPLAVLISKALVEIPPKFAGMPPINPASCSELRRGGTWNSHGAEGLAEDVRYYGERLKIRANEKIGNLYPSENLPDGSPGTVIAWIWARTVRSPDPAAKGASVPLVSSFVLSNKEGKKVWVEVEIDPAARDGYRFEVKSGHLNKSAEEQLKKGTKSGRGTHFVCILTGAAITPDHVRDEGLAGRLDTRLMAIVTEGGRKRAYVSPSQRQEEIARSAKPGDTSHLEVEMPDNPRWFSPPGYGMRRYVDIFTARQLTALNACSAEVLEVRAEALRDALAAPDISADKSHNTVTARAEAYADAIATYLALVVDRMAFYGSSLCGWLAKDNAMGKTMPQQALAMSWDFAEGNPFGKSSSAISTCTKAVADCIHEIRMPTSGRISQVDAGSVIYTKGCLISTDPPYYDNVGYADLSDFFYCWLKTTLGNLYPDLFRRLTTPKELELVATPYRHGSPDAAEQFFMTGMRRVLLQMKSAESEYPIAIYYAFKQQEQSQIGVTSPGWAGFLQAIVDAGFGIDGTWPIRTENPSRSIAQGTNALASSIVLVCRKRSLEAAIATRADFIRALRSELPGAIDDIRSAGVGPVDMQQSVIGPGMGVFSRFVKVLEDDDSAMSVRTALSLINRVWEELENELDTNFDSETQVALAWFATYGFDARTSGELITLANAKNIATNTLFDSGVFKDLKGKTALTPRNELPKGWTPSTDKSLTVWECVQHTARVLNAEDGGGAAAGRLVAEMGHKASEARALGYRLFEIATQKGWAGEALIYNELAQEWPKLEDLASRDAASRTREPAQGRLL